MKRRGASELARPGLRGAVLAASSRRRRSAGRASLTVHAHFPPPLHMLKLGFRCLKPISQLVWGQKRVLFHFLDRQQSAEGHNYKT